MTGKLTVEVDERGLRIKCNLFKVTPFDKRRLVYHIGKVLNMEAGDFTAMGNLMISNFADILYANGNTVEIDLSKIGGDINV